MKVVTLALKRVNIPMAAIVAAILVLVGMGWYLLHDRNERGTPEQFNGYEPLNSVPAQIGITTGIPDIFVAWQDQRVVDGNFSCTVYHGQTKQVVAYYFMASEPNAEGKIESGTTYNDNTISKSSIDQIIEQHCINR